MPENKKNKVLLIGWDAADWKVINPLMDRGKMPNLQRLVESGVKGNIATLHPVLSPMLWTSIATGKRPFKHGIYGFYEPTPDGMNVQPMTNLSRKTKAIWNILQQNGLKSNVIGWWPSHPAEPISGVMVSDLYHKNSISAKENLKVVGGLPKLAKGAIHPPELTEELDELRFDVRELTVNDMMNFIHDAEKIDQTKDNLMAVCAKILAEAISIQSAATHLMETTEWDFTAVYFDAIDHFSHGFMKYHPPRRNHINEEEFEKYKDVIIAGYIYHDMMLGRLIQLAGEDTNIVLLSDHGFHPDHLRPDFVPFEPAGPAIEHRELGIFVAAGPGIKKDELVFGSSLLDITPTLLTLFDLPVGEDMDGRVLGEIFVEPPEIQTIPSWDEVEGDDGRHPPGMQMDSRDSQEALQQLVDLGYIDELKGDRKERIEEAVRELSFNLARSYMDAGRFGDAIPLLLELYTKYPKEYRITMQLAMCFKATNRVDDLDEIIDRLLEQRTHDSRVARGKLAQWRKVAEERRAMRAKAAEEAGVEIESSEDAGLLDKTIFDKSELMKIAGLRSTASLRTYYLDFMKGFALSAKGQDSEALSYLERAIQAEPDRPALHIQIGETYLNLKMLDKAEEAFQKALELDDNNQNVLLGLAQLHLKRNENEDAAHRALESIGKIFFFPMAHYTLGIALTRLERYGQAASALKTAVGQNPNFSQAYRRLAYLYKNHLDDMEAAEEYFELALQTRELELEQKSQRADLPNLELDDENSDIEQTDYSNRLAPLTSLPKVVAPKSAKEMDPETSIVIVTGLPRSGTSLMMQMLEAGGMNVFQDGKREADEDNPKGYLEHEETKSLFENNAWIVDAKGKVIKVVAPLLQYLPAEFDYKVVYMNRDIDEIIQSQNKMLERSGHEETIMNTERLKASLSYQLENSARMLFDKGVTTLRVDYSAALQQPAEAANAVKTFLHLDFLDEVKMASVVDPSLYRNRGSAEVS